MPQRTDPATARAKGRRIVGKERAQLVLDLAGRYRAGESVRALAASTGRSFGSVHRLLVDAEVEMRGPGRTSRRLREALAPPAPTPASGGDLAELVRLGVEGARWLDGSHARDGVR